MFFRNAGELGGGPVSLLKEVFFMILIAVFLLGILFVLLWDFRWGLNENPLWSLILIEFGSTLEQIRRLLVKQWSMLV
jgi:hypothetical protein